MLEKKINIIIDGLEVPIMLKITDDVTEMEAEQMAIEMYNVEEWNKIYIN